MRTRRSHDSGAKRFPRLAMAGACALLWMTAGSAGLPAWGGAADETIVPAGRGMVVAQRYDSRNPDRGQQIFERERQQNLNRLDAQRRERDVQGQQERALEMQRQRQIMQDSVRRQAPDGGQGSNLRNLPPLGSTASRGPGCVAMAFDKSGNGLRVTRRTAYGEGACGQAIAMCRKAVADPRKTSPRFKGAVCRISDP